MYIQPENNLSFQSLYRSGTIRTILKNKPTKKFKSELSCIERNIRKNNLHKQENVDIILGYTKEDGFYGIISSKEQGTPMNPTAQCKISNNKESMNTFTQWVKVWNEAYSPEELQKFRDMMNFVKQIFKK